MPVVHIQFLYSKAKGLKEINIYFKSHSMEHQETVQYLSHLTINWLEKWWSQKAKIIAKLKFMYQPSRYQTPVFRILLCNVLIEPHFGYGFSLWFFLFLFFFLIENQILESSKYVCFCVDLIPRSDINPLQLRKINWLPIAYCEYWF